MKVLSFIFAFLLFGLSPQLIAQNDADNGDFLTVRLEPVESGKLIYNLTEKDSSQENSSSVVHFSLDLYAGWHCVDTLVKYDEAGNSTDLIFTAEPLPKSPFADTLIISEIFFCAHLSDSLSNWFELTNISNHEVKLHHATIQTADGKQRIATDLALPPKSCVQVAADSLLMNFEKDSLILVDSANRIISHMKWDASIMNLPHDSLFSLEIIDVFHTSSDVSNWEIIYGTGRGGLCPEKYAESIGETSIWSWLQFVIWGIAVVLLILIIGLSFKKRKK